MRGGVCKFRPNMNNKVIIITGASSGIGRQTAKVLCSLGATVIMACRDLKKAEETKHYIQRSVGACRIEIMRLDLSDLESVRGFAKAFEEKYSKLDVLINNAGVALVKSRTLTKDNFELHMASNHYGHFLLTNLLLPTLKKTTESRVIIVSSQMYRFAKWDLSNLNSEKSYSSHNAYSLSKLANIYFAKELTARLVNTTVKAVALHPGLVNTEINRNVLSSKLKRALYFLVYPLFMLFFKSDVQGAQTTLYLALCDWRDIVPGGFYADCKENKLTDIGKNIENPFILWEASAKSVKLF